MGKVFPVSEDDFAYAFFKLLEPRVKKWLKEYRDLKKEREAMLKKLSSLEDLKARTEAEIQEVENLIPQAESQRSLSLFLGFILLFIVSSIRCQYRVGLPLPRLYNSLLRRYSSLKAGEA